MHDVKIKYSYFVWAMIIGANGIQTQLKHKCFANLL